MSAPSAARPMTMTEWKACAALRPYVDTYSQRDAQLGRSERYHALPARSDCFLEFYFGDRYRIVNATTGVIHLSPRCVLVGPHRRRREDLILGGHLETFTIRFSAIGFRSIFGIPAHTVCDRALSAELVLGRCVEDLQERLAALDGAGRVAACEAFLLERLWKSRLTGDARTAGLMALRVKQSHGIVHVATLAAKHERSTRQVERLFQEHVGLAPKMFGRLARIARAVKIGETAISGDWAEVAATAGYFDQSHMVREFRDLLGETPVSFAALRTRASEQTTFFAQNVAFVLSGQRGPFLS